MAKNPVAKDLRTPKYRMQIVKAKKGEGSYSRKKPLTYKSNDIKLYNIASKGEKK